MARALMLVPVLACTLNAATPSRVEQRTEPLAMGQKLWVSQVDGNVEVQGWDRPEVSLEARYFDGGRDRRCTLEVNRVAEGLEIKVHEPRSRGWLFSIGSFRSPSCDLVLKVPRRIAMVVHAVDGDLAFRDVDGYVGARTVDGDLRFESIRGEVHANTVDGSIVGKGLDARIKAGTVDGDVTLHGVAGGLAVHTVDGSVEATDLDGWGEGIEVRTVDGNIHVRLGAATGKVQARTVDGHIEVHHPALKVDHLNGGRMEGSVPGRAQAISLATGDGDIRLD